MKQDKSLAFLFFALTVVFILAAKWNQDFFDWIFERHHNQWSWYIRPLFLIPFCFFAFKRSYAGISATIFLLFTSMFWFEKPEIVSDKVKEFLQFEKDWLYSDWNLNKILLLLTVPISFFLLGFAFWNRSLWMGLSVLVLMATGKILWSIVHAGEAGTSILVPAIIGLLLCTTLLYFGFKKLNNKK